MKGINPSVVTDIISVASDTAQKLAKVMAAIEVVAGTRAEFDAGQNRSEYLVSNLMNVAAFTSAARSRIEDADFTKESAGLSTTQVLQQTGTARLEQANAATTSLLAISLAEPENDLTVKHLETIHRP